MPPILSGMMILLSTAVYGFVHSWMASLEVKAWARRRFGSLADRLYRLAYNLFAVISFLPILALVLLLPDQKIYVIRSPWVLLTGAFQTLAILTLIVGLFQTGFSSFLGIKQLLLPQAEISSQLVVRGLYRWVRHPLYTAGIVFIWLVPVMTVNVLALNIGLTLHLVIGAHYEERKLIREFGEVYRRYCQTTPMLIPNPFKSKLRHPQPPPRD